MHAQSVLCDHTHLNRPYPPILSSHAYFEVCTINSLVSKFIDSTPHFRNFLIIVTINHKVVKCTSVPAE